MTSRSIYANKRHLEKSRPMLCWKILWQILFSVFKLGSRIYIESGLSAMGFHLWTRTGLKRSYPRMCILYPNVCVEKRMKVVSAHKEQHNWMKEKACIKMIPSLTARHIESWILSDYCNPFLLMCWSHSHVARKTNRVFFFFFSQCYFWRGTCDISTLTWFYLHIYLPPFCPWWRIWVAIRLNNINMCAFLQLCVFRIS